MANVTAVTSATADTFTELVTAVQAEGGGVASSSARRSPDVTIGGRARRAPSDVQNNNATIDASVTQSSARFGITGAPLNAADFEFA